MTYEHGSYYYNHTTRHGGNFSLDPLLAIFRNMWKRLSYAISSQTGTLEGRVAADAFQLYKTQHKAASVIQRAFRKHCLKKVRQDFGTPAKLQGVFCGLKFVFSGSIPKIDGESYSHEKLKNLIEDAGGLVSPSLPAKHKQSTKRYIALTNRSNSRKQKLSACIIEAIRAGYDILSFEFVTDSVKQGAKAAFDDYVLSFPSIPFHISGYRSLERTHFSRRKSC